MGLGVTSPAKKDIGPPRRSPRKRKVVEMDGKNKSKETPTTVATNRSPRKRKVVEMDGKNELKETPTTVATNTAKKRKAEETEAVHVTRSKTPTREAPTTLSDKTNSSLKSTPRKKNTEEKDMTGLVATPAGRSDESTVDSLTPMTKRWQGYSSYEDMCRAKWKRNEDCIAKLGILNKRNNNENDGKQKVARKK